MQFTYMKSLFFFVMLMAVLNELPAQENVATMQNQSAYTHDAGLDGALEKILQEVELNGIYDVGEDGKTPVSFAVIDLKGPSPVMGHVNGDGFIYPASVYKMYVAMEVLRQVSEGKYGLHDAYVVQSPNDVDKTSEIVWDPRPLLRAGDTVTIGYLLDLMITRSDNSASNCLIDVAGRKAINATMHKNGWKGSEVTRKFLPRRLEDEGYANVPGTVTCAAHAADFMYKIQTQTLENPWVSMQLKSLLGRQLDTTKLAAGLPPGTMFYHKTGWWGDYTNDVGIVDDGDVRYVVALFVPVREAESRDKIQLLSRKVYDLMKQRQKSAP